MLRARRESPQKGRCLRLWLTVESTGSDLRIIRENRKHIRSMSTPCPGHRFGHADDCYGRMAGKAGDSREPEPFWLWLRDRHVFTGTLPPPWIRRALAQMSGSKDDTRSLFEKQTLKTIARVEDYHNYIRLSSSDFSLVRAHAVISLHH